MTDIRYLLAHIAPPLSTNLQTTVFTSHRAILLDFDPGLHLLSFETARASGPRLNSSGLDKWPSLNEAILLVWSL